MSRHISYSPRLDFQIFKSRILKPPISNCNWNYFSILYFFSQNHIFHFQFIGLSSFNLAIEMKDVLYLHHNELDKSHEGIALKNQASIFSIKNNERFMKNRGKISM